MKIGSGLGLLGMDHWVRMLDAKHSNNLTETVKKIKKGGVEMVIFDPFTLNQALGGTSGIFTDEVKTALASLFSETLQLVPNRYLVYDSYYSRRFEGMREFSVNGELVFHRMMDLTGFVKFCDNACTKLERGSSE